MDVALKLARVFSKPLHELISDVYKPGPHCFIQRAADTPTLEARWRHSASNGEGRSPVTRSTCLSRMGSPSRRCTRI